jgi:branched-chain amino acid transport system substrate-binding protein
MLNTNVSGRTPGLEWGGEPFCLELSKDGGQFHAERDGVVGVPKGLVELARRMFRVGVERCDFYWQDRRSTLLCRVSAQLLIDHEPHIVVTGEKATPLPFGLTARELEVLTLVIGGITNSDMARRLSVSERTISTHLVNILRKMGVSNRTAAATQALDAGLILAPIPGGPSGFENLDIGRLLSEVAPSKRAPRISVLKRRKYRLGMLVPVQESRDDDGLEMLRGTQLAVEEINSWGGIRGRCIEPVFVDVDINDLGSIKWAMNKLVDSEADVITSGYLSRQDVAHDIVVGAGVPYLHAATMSRMEERVKGDPHSHRHIFQISPSDIQYGPEFIEFLNEIRSRGDWKPLSRKIVVLDQSAWESLDFGLDRAAELASIYGWDLQVLKVGQTQGPETWTDAAARACESGPAAIMIGSYLVEDHIEAIRSMRRLGSNALIYSVYAPSIPRFRAELGKDALGVVWSTTAGTYSDALGHSFASRFKDRFGAIPGRSHAGVAYDRTLMIAQGWARTNRFLDAAEFSRNIRLSTYRGVNGPYYFNNPQQTPEALTIGKDPTLCQPHLVYQVQATGHEILSPAYQKTGSFQVLVVTVPKT